MPKISVIIPVYNIEEYIGRCIDSIINQTFKDIEIIAVDDGSTDNSGKIYIMNKPAYYYCRRENSASGKQFDDYLIQINKMYLYLKSRFEKHRKADILIPQLKKYIVNKMLLLKLFSDKPISFYLFPYEKIKRNSNIIIYGAGEVGISYYNQSQRLFVLRLRCVLITYGAFGT